MRRRRRRHPSGPGQRAAIRHPRRLSCPLCWPHGNHFGSPTAKLKNGKEHGSGTEAELDIARTKFGDRIHCEFFFLESEVKAKGAKALREAMEQREEVEDFRDRLKNSDFLCWEIEHPRFQDHLVEAWKPGSTTRIAPGMRAPPSSKINRTSHTHRH